WLEKGDFYKFNNLFKNNFKFPEPMYKAFYFNASFQIFAGKYVVNYEEAKEKGVDIKNNFYIEDRVKLAAPHVLEYVSKIENKRELLQSLLQTMNNFNKLTYISLEHSIIDPL